jgi:hypothetical protein
METRIIKNVRKIKTTDSFVYNLNVENNHNYFIEKTLLHNSPNVVMDESALVPDQDEALVFRMLGDQKDNFYVKIGNPWDTLHFRKSFEDPNYFKYIVDYKQGLMEGRISPELIEEARKKPFFDVLYECKFPPEGKPDDEGWMPLLTRDDIDRALVDTGIGFGVNRLGCDVAGEGRNFSVIVQRHTNLAELLIRKHTPDIMTFAENIINLKKSKEVKASDIFIDKNGIGKGVFDITARELEGIFGINVGEKPYDEYSQGLYLNLRAMLFWRIREWVLRGGKLLKSRDYPEAWYELCSIKYNKKIEGMRGKLQIMSKEKMGKEGIESPDVADALALTFFLPDGIIISNNDDFFFNQEDKSFDPKAMFPEI